jgi:hypothetical protein
MNQPARILSLVALAAMGAAHATDFAPPGAKATLSVEYRYESSGKVPGNGGAQFELREWFAKRAVDMSAELVAGKPLPMPSLQAPDAAATAKTQQQGAQLQKAQAQMAPMMAGAEAIVARCGNDEKCIEREVMKMGTGMAGSPQLDATLKTGRDTAAAVQGGGDRYQVWRAAAQKGQYTIDGRAKRMYADPICMGLPQQRCLIDTVSRGAGDVPGVPGGRGGPAAAEIDVQAKTITLVLPVPMGTLPYTDSVTTNEPPAYQVVKPGTHARQLRFVTTAHGTVAAGQPLTVALKGGWRSQAGEQVVQIPGAGPDGGRLVVRWRFSAP